MMLTSLFAGLLAPVLGINVFARDVYSVLLAVMLVLISMLPAYIKGWMGAGDVKFLLVLAVWLGFSPILVFSVLGGSLLALLHTLLFCFSQVFFNRGIGIISIGSSGHFLNFINYKNKKEKVNKFIPYAGYVAISCIFFLFLDHKG